MAQNRFQCLESLSLQMEQELLVSEKPVKQAKKKSNNTAAISKFCIAPLHKRNTKIVQTQPYACQFSVLNYNILAQTYARSAYFPATEKSALQWMYAITRIMFYNF